jgi:hypothetical protein
MAAVLVVVALLPLTRPPARPPASTP